MIHPDIHVSKEPGAFPYGPPSPDDVRLASAAVRALTYYQLAVEAGRELPPVGVSDEHVAGAQDVAQAAFIRAILGSRRVTSPPVQDRAPLLPPTDDPEATSASSDLGEAQQDYAVYLQDLDTYATPPSYGHEQQIALRAALMHAARTAKEPSQVIEVQEVAVQEGYDDVLEALATTPQPLDVTEHYARAA